MQEFQNEGSETEMKFRHEWKHEISVSDCITLRARLNAIAKPDIHGDHGHYKIRSLYFDDSHDTALREKINGVNVREKFRIRYYNNDSSYICLEKKSKINGLTNKESVVLNIDEVQNLLKGDYSWMVGSSQPLLREFYSKIYSKGLKPKTIVDYTREAFVFPAGNVRITLDYNIRTGLGSTDFLNSSCVTIPAGNAPIILEVKWDEYLPDIIRDAIQLPGRHSSAFSKYAACRIYG